MTSETRPNALILGGAGFLGSHLAAALAKRACEVTVLDRPGVSKKNLAGLHGKIRYRSADFAASEIWADALDRAEWIFHCVGATTPGLSNADPEFDLETNLPPTLRMFDRLREHRGRKVIFLSSGGAVYGVPHRLPIDETHPTRPLCAYGVHKLAIEHYGHLYKHLYGLDVRIARPANPYGPHQNPDSGQGAIAAFLDRLHTGRALELWGDGSVERDFFFVEDLIDGLIKLAEYDGPHDVFNFGSGRARSMEKLIEEIFRITGREGRVTRLGSRSEDVPTNALDIGLAEKELGWRPTTSLEKGIAQTWAALEA